MVIDPIADMLNRIRNATARQFSTAQVPTSRLKEAIAQLLTDQGWLAKYELVSVPETLAYLLLTFKYYRGRSVIRGLKQISKPGQRIHMNKSELSKILSNRLETVVVSTSDGLMTGAAAKAKGKGGEVLFKVW